MTPELGSTTIPEGEQTILTTEASLWFDGMVGMGALYCSNRGEGVRGRRLAHSRWLQEEVEEGGRTCLCTKYRCPTIIEYKLYLQV